MPRPKKVATHDYEIEHDYIVNTDVNSELISDLEIKVSGMVKSRISEHYWRYF